MFKTTAFVDNVDYDFTNWVIFKRRKKIALKIINEKKERKRNGNKLK